MLAAEAGGVTCGRGLRGVVEVVGEVGQGFPKHKDDQGD
jgi:hypothetical protein